MRGFNLETLARLDDALPALVAIVDAPPPRALPAAGVVVPPPSADVDLSQTIAAPVAETTRPSSEPSMGRVVDEPATEIPTSDGVVPVATSDSPRAPQARRGGEDCTVSPGEGARSVASALLPSPTRPSLGLFVGAVRCGAADVKLFAASIGRKRVLRMQLVVPGYESVHVTLGAGAVSLLIVDLLRAYAGLAGRAFSLHRPLEPRRGRIGVWSPETTDDADGPPARTEPARPRHNEETSLRRPGVPRGRTSP